MDYLTLNDIIEHALENTTADVEMPEWGGMVKVRALSSTEMSRCERQATNPRTEKTDGIELQARMVEVGCVEPKFAPGQYKVLMGKEPGSINRMATRIMELSGIESDELIQCTCPECDHTFVVNGGGIVQDDQGEA